MYNWVKNIRYFDPEPSLGTLENRGDTWGVEMVQTLFYTNRNKENYIETFDIYRSCD